jgi:hypothetical protein
LTLNEWSVVLIMAFIIIPVDIVRKVIAGNALK